MQSGMQSVVWTEGMLLTQQHLQLRERLSTKYWHRRLQFNQGNVYGLNLLELDQLELHKHRVVIQRCEGILSTGEFIWFQKDQEDVCLDYRVVCAVGATQRLYLLVSREMDIQGLEGYSESKRRLSSVANYLKVTDQYDGAREAEIVVARRRFMIVEENDCLDDKHALCLMTVRNLGDDGLEIVEHDIPPIVNIGVSKHLDSIIRSTLMSLEKEIKEYPTRVDLGQHMMDTSHGINLCIRERLQVQFYSLRDLYRRRHHAHPEELYQWFLTNISVLSVWQHKSVDWEIPAYNHERIGADFKYLSELHDDLMHISRNQFCNEYEFEKKFDDEYQIKSIHRESFYQDLYLAIHFKNREENIEAFIDQSRLSSSGLINHLISTSTPGVKLIHKSRVPQGLSVKGGYEYFFITPSGASWESVIEEKNMSFYIPKRMVVEKMYLLALKK